MLCLGQQRRLPARLRSTNGGNASSTHSCAEREHAPSQLVGCDLSKLLLLASFFRFLALAIPPMIGWAAARGTIEAGAWSLFAILLLWQLPHFFAIAWMYRDDYSRAGFRMISSDDSSGERSASQSVFFCILLLVIAGLPTFLGIATLVYLAIELALGGLFIAVAMRFLKKRTVRAARLLFITSIVYLPLLLGALVLTKS